MLSALQLVHFHVKRISLSQAACEAFFHYIPMKKTTIFCQLLIGTVQSILWVGGGGELN